ncbi:MAG: response regulator [Anaerolineales bacterium]|nr:response regulator [Anaerolineales bacterium]
MGKERLLIVEDDADISNMLKIYFTGLGFDVDVAWRGSDALEKTRQVLPHLIVLDIMLPDINGYEVCRTLRTNTRTSHIPVIFLTQKDERSDRLQGLELGADDYITKPFDIEELKLRVQGAIRRSERESLTDPRSGLPAGRLIEEQLRRTIRADGWAYMDIRINYFDQFKEVYGFVAGDDVLRFTAMLMGEVVDELGSPGDFIGHAGGDNFVIVTSENSAANIRQRLIERFGEEAQTHYNFMDRQQGYIMVAASTMLCGAATIMAANPDGRMENTPLMRLAIGVVTPKMQPFADIREITETAAEMRRQDAASNVSKG